MNWAAIIFAVVLVTIFVGIADSIRSIPQVLIVGFLAVAVVYFFRRRLPTISPSVHATPVPLKGTESVKDTTG